MKTIILGAGITGLAAGHKKKSAYKKQWCKKNPWYSSLWGAKQRCSNKNNPKYKNYGARGIKFLISREEVKFLWKRDKAADLVRPSLDRINNDGNYELSNCRFIEKSINDGRHNRELTHCKRGHPYNKKNTRLKSNGWRDCKVCGIIMKNIREGKAE